MGEVPCADLHPQEQTYVLQSLRKEIPLRVQTQRLKEFYASEAHKIGLVVADTVFTEQKGLQDWEICGFSSALWRASTIPRISSEFQELLLGDNSSLQLVSHVIRLKCTVTLRSLACEIALRVKLTGGSSLWIYTREGLNSPNAVVCNLRKEVYSNRLFAILGANIGEENTFKFFKKQEIPEMCFIKHLELFDSIELEFAVVDNGDERVYVEFARNVRVSCRNFIPTLEDCPVFAGGSGDGVTLDYIRITQKKRDTVPSKHTYCADCRCSVL